MRNAPGNPVFFFSVVVFLFASTGPHRGRLREVVHDGHLQAHGHWDAARCHRRQRERRGPGGRRGGDAGLPGTPEYISLLADTRM